MCFKYAEKYPEDVKYIVSGAPVGDWKLYDAAYTERYFGYNTSSYPFSSRVFDESSICPTPRFIEKFSTAATITTCKVESKREELYDSESDETDEEEKEGEEDNVEEMNGRILLVCGDEDDNVLPINSQTISRRLHESNIPHIFQMFPGEKHGFIKQENTKLFYELLEKMIRVR